MEANNTWWQASPKMDAISALRTRRSVRNFTPDPVDDALISEIIAAGTSAPSAGNQQPWQFVVIKEKETLLKAEKLSPYISFLSKAPVAILVCGDVMLEKHNGFWIQDVSACIQNMLIAAHAYGLGAVWCGVHPVKERVEAFQKLVNAPQNIIPAAIIPIGYPLNVPAAANRYDESRVHKELFS